MASGSRARAPRALLVATTRADGADIDGQARALQAVRTAFDKIATPGLRLVVSGAGKFAVEARERIRSEVERLAVLGSAIVVVLLWLAFASLRALAVALAAGRHRRRRRHRRGRARLRPGARHDARLRHDPDRRSGRLRDLLPGPDAAARAGAADALATRELADGAARPVHVADRFRRAGLHRLSRPRATRRVLDRRSRRRGGDDSLRLPAPRPARRARRRLSRAGSRAGWPRPPRSCRARASPCRCSRRSPSSCWP